MTNSDFEKFMDRLCEASPRDTTTVYATVIHNHRGRNIGVIGTKEYAGDLARIARFLGADATVEKIYHRVPSTSVVYAGDII